MTYQCVLPVLMLLIALMLGLLIALVDSSPNWDDTGVTAAAILIASGLVGTVHLGRAWLWALAVGLWIPVLGIVLNHTVDASVLAIVFAMVGAYSGSFVGKQLRRFDSTT